VRCVIFRASSGEVENCNQQNLRWPTGKDVETAESHQLNEVSLQG